MELICQSLDTSQSDLSEGCIADVAPWVWRCACVATTSIYQMADGLLSEPNKTGTGGNAALVVRWGRLAARSQALRTSRHLHFLSVSIDVLSLDTGDGQCLDSGEIVEEALHPAERCSKRTVARFTNVSVPRLWDRCQSGCDVSRYEWHPRFDRCGAGPSGRWFAGTTRGTLVSSRRWQNRGCDPRRLTQRILGLCSSREVSHPRILAVPAFQFELPELLWSRYSSLFLKVGHPGSTYTEQVIEAQDVRGHDCPCRR